MDKIKTIVGKEWSEVFKNRLVLFTVGFLPLLFIALPIITLLTTGSLGEADTGEITEIPGVDQLCAGYEGAECMQIYMLNLYGFMFMILPVAIPVTIAAYSVVGEKTTRSLEPLLATPISTVELLAGKALAAMIPAVVATWLSYLIFVVAAAAMVGSLAVNYLLSPLWLVAIFVVGPLLTFLAVSVALMVSSRVTDPRVAEQLSMVVILPIIMVVIGQSVGLFFIDRFFILIAALVTLLLDLVLAYITVNAFQRERILTRWK